MTPEARRVASANRWLKIAAREMLRIASDMEKFRGKDEEDEFNAYQKRIVDLRQQAKRCAHHGLGMTVQQLLPLEKK
jgi:hypothetical protein